MGFMLCTLEAEAGESCIPAQSGDIWRELLSKTKTGSRRLLSRAEPIQHAATLFVPRCHESALATSGIRC
ncbi:hypothetical protein LEMLEM_LOCUS23908 [Lemmus lemmus]